jgi:hypothetical protein
MSSALIQCESCKRHVFAQEAACPFCRAPLGGGGRGLAAVIVLSAGLSLAGCNTPEAPSMPAYGVAPPPLTAAPVTTATATATATAMPPPVPAYGGPPPLSTASATASPPPKPPPVSVPAPAYGAPPPRSP